MLYLCINIIIILSIGWATQHDQNGVEIMNSKQAFKIAKQQAEQKTGLPIANGNETDVIAFEIYTNLIDESKKALNETWNIHGRAWN